MASQRLAASTNNDTSLNTVYAVPANATAEIYSFVLTNTVATLNTVDVYVNDGSTDRLLVKTNVPSGQGKTTQVAELFGSLSGGDVVKIQAVTADAFNILLTGRVLT